MNRPHAPTRGRKPPSAYSLGRVAAVSLTMTLALPAIVVALAVPGLTLAFAAGALTALVVTHRPTASEWALRLRGTVSRARRPTGE